MDLKYHIVNLQLFDVNYAKQMSRFVVNVVSDWTSGDIALYH